MRTVDISTVRIIILLREYIFHCKCYLRILSGYRTKRVVLNADRTRKYLLLSAFYLFSEL